MKTYLILFSFFSLALLPACRVGPDSLLRSQSRVEDTQELHKEFIKSVIEECKAPISEARSLLLTEQITRVANRYFEKREEKEAFVFLICIESKFTDRAKSSVGAVGLTQVMPKFAQGFAQACGLGNLKTEDLQDAEMNLNIGGCWFSSLIKYHHSIALALAAYNSGRDSSSVQKLQALANINSETANYVAKYTILKGRFDKGGSREDK